MLTTSIFSDISYRFKEGLIVYALFNLLSANTLKVAI